MRLGNFSVSLAVQDLAASRAFYEKLGFKGVGGDGKSWLVLKNGLARIGLFQGMFQGNILTFNPGWDGEGQPVAEFDDVRDIQRTLRDRGIEPATPADESSTGPAHLVVIDPDGNTILIDQHVPKA
jgi:catechol 2,3-dioxygenase-like lactoylglutathione lyase family enzyme